MLPIDNDTGLHSDHIGPDGDRKETKFYLEVIWRFPRI